MNKYLNIFINKQILFTIMLEVLFTMLVSEEVLKKEGDDELDEHWNKLN